MGIETIVSISGFDRNTIEGIIEPWLLQKGRIIKTPKGRIATWNVYISSENIVDNYVRRAKVNRVVDGDTVDLEVDLGYHISLSIRGRLLGVDTPERGRPDFALATNTLASLLEENADKDGYVSVKSTKTGKYGRWLVEIEGVNPVLEQKWPYEY